MSKGGMTDKARAMLAEVAPRKPEAVKPSRQAPTPEQMRGGRFVRGSSKTDRGQVSAVAYHRHPQFETLAKGNTGIDAEGLAALRYYRTRHEESDASLTRCALDMEGRGGGVPQCLPPHLWADETVKRLEVAMGAVADTMRAVALQDQSFSQVAIARFGSRKQNWLITDEQRAVRERNENVVPGKRKPVPRFEDKIVPISGRHREIIRDEFLLALSRLRLAVGVMTSTVRPPKGPPTVAAPVPVEQTAPTATPAPNPSPAVDPAFINEAGYLRPWDEIAALIKERLVE